MRYHIETAKLWKAPYTNVRRLAQFLKVNAPTSCVCLYCRAGTISRVVRKMGWAR